MSVSAKALFFWGIWYSRYTWDSNIFFSKLLFHLKKKKVLENIYFQKGFMAHNENPK